MERKDFLKQACGVGLCSCAVGALFTSFPCGAAAEDTPPKAEDWRIGFARKRYAKLLESLAKRTDEKTVGAVLEDVGRYCASTVPFIASHAGDPDGFFAEIMQRWGAGVNYDRERRAATLSFPVGDRCPCALVEKGLTPPSMCTCSLGWQKHAFETVFGRPVEVALKESVLRGGTRCTFEVHTTRTT